MTQPNGQCLRVGICGIGLDAYWPQFDGLKQRLEGYMALVASQIDKARSSPPVPE